MLSSTCCAILCYLVSISLGNEKYGSIITCQSEECASKSDPWNLYCDDNKPCSVSCVEYRSCRDAIIHCPANSNCIINCQANEGETEGCRRIKIMAQNSTLMDLYCSETENACDGLTVYCPIMDNPQFTQCNIYNLAENTFKSNSNPSKIYTKIGFEDVSINTMNDEFTPSEEFKIFCGQYYHINCTVNGNEPPYTCNECLSAFTNIPSPYPSNIASNQPTEQLITTTNTPSLAQSNTHHSTESVTNLPSITEVVSTDDGSSVNNLSGTASEMSFLSTRWLIIFGSSIAGICICCIIMFCVCYRTPQHERKHIRLSTGALQLAQSAISHISDKNGHSRQCSEGPKDLETDHDALAIIASSSMDKQDLSEHNLIPATGDAFMKTRSGSDDDCAIPVAPEPPIVEENSSDEENVPPPPLPPTHGE